MTRGEALLAMEGGARVRQVWKDNSTRSAFCIYEGDLFMNGAYAGIDGKEEFFNCENYEILPEPDTAEKFVRDLSSYLNSKTNLKDYLFDPLFGQSTSKEDMAWRKRFNALLAQMDGEK